MKRSLLPAILGLVLLAGCEPYNPKPPKKNTGGWHPPAPVADTPIPDEPRDRPRDPAPEPVVTDDPPPAPVPAPPVRGEIPYAKPVPGRPGLVTSPFEPYKGFIDVRGYPPGTEVKDPNSDKTFLVPPL
ncbi:MAG TPA: hypothetical protein VGO90_15715 [Chthoniobacteraceae bacterium]|jgi:hypothetical protein|nr:hypothetical protein [Chthoniobacteraceae bacterium]